MRQVKQSIAAAVAPLTGFEPSTIEGLFKTPDKPQWGDLTLPCFPFARTMRKAPNDIAAAIAAALAPLPGLAGVTAMGPFVNITLDNRSLALRLLPSLLNDASGFGRFTPDKRLSVVIDFSSPNIAKPIAFHHIRSTVLGSALARVYTSLGHRVERVNYLGDWGTTQGKLIEAFRRYGDRDTLQRQGIRHLLDIYVRFNQEAQNDPSLEEHARQWFVRCEADDPEALELWRLFRDISMAEFSRIYDLLGVAFDHIHGESMYHKKADEVFDLAAKNAGATESDGAYVIPLEEENLPPILLRKQDGATLYATRDIAAAMDRHERFGFDRCLYVVASQQALYFQQLRHALTKLGFDWADGIVHVPFGMLSIKDPDSGEVSTGSTRRGNVVFLEDVLNRAMEKVADMVRENAGKRDLGLSPEQQAVVTRQVGVGAIIFADLSNRRVNDVVFDWDRMLSMQGDTGVHVQYTHARCASMLREARDTDISAFDPAHYTRPEEHGLLVAFSRYHEVLLRAAADCEPSYLADYLLELTKSFGSVYELFKTEGYRFLDDDPGVRASRMALVKATARMLKEGLAILGIEAPDRM